MNNPFLLILIILFYSSSNLHSQASDEVFKQNIEYLSEQKEVGDADYSAIFEYYDFYLKHPLNLNTASKEELLQLPFFTEIMAVNLIQHIKKNKDLLALNELQGIEGFDLETIKRILPFITINEKLSLSKLGLDKLAKNGKNQLILRHQRILESQAGYKSRTEQNFIASPNSYYLGSADKIYMKYHFQSPNKISWGLIAEKDAGEPLRAIDSLNKKPGFDFYTAHLCIRNLSFLKTLVIGDFQASFGQGLVMWTGFSFGKTSNILTIKRNAGGIKAYNSADENNFLRGLATTLKFKKLELSFYASSRKRDAKITFIPDSNSGGLQETTSIIETGLHNTLNSLKTKATFNQKNFGSNFTYQNNRLSIGINLQGSDSDIPITKQSNYYNQFTFNGKSNYTAGVDFSYVIKNMNYFGEFAKSKNGGNALITGILVCLDKQLSFTALYRNYSKKFQNQFSSALSENTFNQNEKAICIGMEANSGKALRINAYLDRFSIPWLKYQVVFPSNGYELSSQLSWAPNKKTEAYVRYRKKLKEENGNKDESYLYTVQVNQENLRVNLSTQVHPCIRLHSRIEGVFYTKEGMDKETGLLILQDIVYKKEQSHWEICFRYSLFDCKNYNCRIYAYENEMPSSFSIPANYGTGIHVYLLVNYKANKQLEFWIKLAQTHYTDKQIINEGTLNQISGSTKTEIKTQIAYNF